MCLPIKFGCFIWWDDAHLPFFLSHKAMFRVGSLQLRVEIWDLLYIDRMQSICRRVHVSSHMQENGSLNTLQPKIHQGNLKKKPKMSCFSKYSIWLPPWALSSNARAQPRSVFFQVFCQGFVLPSFFLQSLEEKQVRHTSTNVKMEGPSTN